MNHAKTSIRKTSVTREATKYGVSAVIVGLGVAGFFLLSSLAKPPSTRPSTSLIPQVKVQEVEAFAGQLDLEVSGLVVPFREIRVAAEVAGRITKKFPACEAGQYVSKGEPLLEIDKDDYQLDIKTTEAELEQAKRRIEENQRQIEGEQRNVALAERDLKIQQQEFERNRRLSDVLSQTELDQTRRGMIAAESALTQRKNTLETLLAAKPRLEAALQLTERQLEKAKLNLQRSTVLAPDEGVIVTEMVQEGDFVSRGTNLLLFEDTRQAEIVCNLTRFELSNIRKYASLNDDLAKSAPEDSKVSKAARFRSAYQLPPTPVTIEDPDHPGVQWKGVLERFDGIGVDDVTKTIPCRIVVRQPVVDSDTGQHALMRGMYVKCRLEFHASSGNQANQFLAIPEVALHPNGYVWLVENEQLRHKKIDVVDRTERELEGISSVQLVVNSAQDSVKPGDWVVVSPIAQPVEGATVEVENPELSNTDEDNRELSLP